MYLFANFVYSEQGEETGRAEHEEGLDATFAAQQEEMGGRRLRFQLVDDVKSLLCVFVDVGECCQ